MSLFISPVITLTGTYQTITGVPLTGYVNFTVATPITDATGQVILGNSTQTATLNSAGSFSIVLPCTDNTQLNPVNFSYLVTEVIPGLGRAYSIQLPHTLGSTVDISTLSPVTTSPSVFSYLPLPSGAATAGYVPVATGSGEASTWTPLAFVNLAPPTGVAATDTAAIQTAENTLHTAGGGVIFFQPGTYVVTGLTKQASVIWQGSDRYATIIQLANGSNTDVVQGASFNTLTLSGSNTGGIGGWGIRDLTIDGNKANQSGTSYGLRFYGYEFDLTRVSIRNCLTDGLYSEWGSFGNPNPDAAMEAVCLSLKIHGNGGNGWVNRGPHDSRAYDVTIFDNGSGAVSYWGQSCSSVTAYTVAAGSNGVNTSTFAGAGVLNVNTTRGFPSASISSTQGSLTVATGGTPAVITYTGTTATTFTGCTTVSGGGVLSTGGSVKATGGGYGSDGQILHGMHCYDGPLSTAWQYLLDATTFVTGSVAEAGTTGSLLIRAPNCSFVGSTAYDTSVSKPGYGIQLGDAANAAFGVYIRATADAYGSTSAANAALVISNDSGTNDVELAVNAPSGATTVTTGTPNANSHYQVTVSGLGTLQANAAPSFGRLLGQQKSAVPQTNGAAWVVSQAGVGDVANLDTSTLSTGLWSWVNGLFHRFFTGNYTSPWLDLDGVKAHVNPRSGTSQGLNPSVVSNVNTTGAAIAQGSSDTAGRITATMVASPAAGNLVTLTFKNGWTTNHPSVVVMAGNAATGLVQLYVTITFTGFTIAAASVPPAGADSAALEFEYHVFGMDG